MAQAGIRAFTEAVAAAASCKVPIDVNHIQFLEFECQTAPRPESGTTA